MAFHLHNFIWDKVRLVQTESQPHHIAGVLTSIREGLDNSDADWEDILSAYYECEDDGTFTFYEGESAEAGNPGIWTYLFYECEETQEGVVENRDLDTLAPLLTLKELASTQG